MTLDYFEDCAVGDKVTTAGRTMTETDIVQFAAMTGDWNPIHADAEFAKDGKFGGRIAHGMLTLAVGTGLLFRLIGHALLPKTNVTVAGLEKVRFLAPVRIGDTLRLSGEIIKLLDMPDQLGLIRVKFTMLNQSEEEICMGHLKLVAERRPLQPQSDSEKEV